MVQGKGGNGQTDKKFSRGFIKKAVIKMTVLLVLLFLTLSFLKSEFSNIYEDVVWKADSSKLSVYDRYLNTGDYNGLRSTMHLYGSYNEMFDSYWEVADAYEYLCEYKVWSRAAEELPDSESYESRMALCGERLIRLCSNSPFEKNQGILSGFAKELTE